MAYREDDAERREADDDGEEELDENDYKTQKDAILFAIDCSKSMLKQPPAPAKDKKADQDSALTAALKCAYELMKQRVISNPKDMMGILLFGTEKTKFRDEDPSKEGYPHCYLLIDLDIPSARTVKNLRDMAETGYDPDKALTPTDETVRMMDVFFCANQVFATSAPNFGSRRLFIITDNDDPHKGDKAARGQAATRAKDLFDLGATIELFPISQAGQTFNIEKFYTDIIYRDPAVPPGLEDQIKTSKSGDGLGLLKSLISNINSKQTPKRAYFTNLDFELAPGMTISVNGYIVLNRQVAVRSCYVYTQNDKTHVVYGETVQTEDVTHRAVEKSELKKAYKFGPAGDLIYFAPDELAAVRKIDGKCLRVIGFKPRSYLPVWASVRKSVFIFPTEAKYVNSTRVFSALWKKLLESDKMAIAWHVPRKNANPVLVAILPSKDPADESSGTSYLPAGLWLCPLPFVDDIRDVDSIKTKEVHRASDELINDMRVVVQNLQLPKAVYDPFRYPNPALQWHYKILQTIALEDDIPVATEKDDHTLPKYKAIAKRVGGYQEDFKNTLDVEAQKLVEQLAVKREADDDADERPKKKRATAKPTPTADGGMGLAELKAAVADESLSKMTVVNLKAILTDKGLNTAGKKVDLLERLEQWVEEN